MYLRPSGRKRDITVLWICMIVEYQEQKKSHMFFLLHAMSTTSLKHNMVSSQIENRKLNVLVGFGLDSRNSVFVLLKSSET